MKRTLAALCACAFFVSSPGLAAKRLLQPQDCRRIIDVEEPAISPDGQRIAFIAIRSDYAHAAYVNSLMLLDVLSGKVTTLHSGGDVAVPRWSPDGTRLAYLARPHAGEKLQLFVRNASGATAALTHGAGDVVDEVWKPDGTAIAFAAYDPESDRGYFEVGDNDYTLTAQTPPVHLWLATPGGGSARRLTSGSWTIAPTDPGGIFTSQFAWSRDGRRLSFTRVETTYTGRDEDSTIQTLDLGTGRVTKLTQHQRYEVTPQISPDGSRVAYWYPAAGNYLAQNELHVRTGAGDAIVSQSLDRNIGGSLWMPNGKSLLTCGDDGAHSSAWIIPLHGTPQRLALGKLNIACDSYSSSTFDAGIVASIARNGAIAFVATDPSHARELYYLSSVGATPRKLTHFNDFTDALELAKMTQFSWNGPDGRRETGVVTYPPGMQPGKKYPIVLLIHGGPGLASIDSFVYEAWPLAHLIAARGYIVFQPNYRGSDDSGNTYMLAIAGDTVVGPSKDIMSGLAAVKQLPQADGSRVAVSGWSYGGLLTSWLITQSHEWKAAVSGAAVNDETEEYNVSVSNVQNRYYLGTTPYSKDGANIYAGQSPITYAASITTPTLIWSTTGDAVVPTTMSYALYHALRVNHVPVKFIEFVAPTHGPSNPVNTEQLTAFWLDWLDRYMQ